MVVWLNKHAKYDAKRRSDAEAVKRHREANRRHHAANASDLNAARIERQREKPELGRAAVERYRGTEKGRAARRRAESTPKARAAHAEGVRRRRARLRGAPAEQIDVQVLLDRQSGRCGLCSEPLGVQREVDHVIPIALGGSHTYDNVQLTHPTCNRRKGARLMEEAA